MREPTSHLVGNSEHAPVIGGGIVFFLEEIRNTSNQGNSNNLAINTFRQILSDEQASTSVR